MKYCPSFTQLLYRPQQFWKTHLETAAWFQIGLSASISTAIVIGLSLTGFFQLMEWALFDQAVRLRPEEPPDPHIVIVTFDELDLNYKIGTWPIPDDDLSDILNRIKSHHPRVIGLDLYRNLPVGDKGYEALVETFEKTPNLYGVSQQVGKQEIGAAPVLERLNRITLADILPDLDGKVRRALLSVRSAEGIKLSLGTQLALDYLKGEGIEPVSLNNTEIRLGKAHLRPLTGNNGPYVRSDRGGYQIFINYRGTAENFHTISITDILDNNIPQDLLRDRVVLIGATAKSLNDYFQTPYNSVFLRRPSPSVPGVVIHANIASELINAALTGRSLIKTIPDRGEWLWAWMWSGAGALLTDRILRQGGASRRKSGGISLVLMGTVALEILLFTSFGVAVGLSWWLPVIPAALGLAISTLLLTNRHLHGLVTLDELTQVANRRSLDTYLRQIFASRETKVSLILCDIDCFKQYNDTYGHQQGDVCLREVAQAMKSIVKGQDLVARYGGEEFAVILKGADAHRAKETAERICERVRALNIPHIKSQVSPYVTLSCGVSTRLIDRTMSQEDLILLADQALYTSKQHGRNCVTLNPLPTVSS